jgi:methionine aminotransferase
MEQHLVKPIAEDKLPHFGTTIFTVMTALANEVGAINLSQGFPDFPVDRRLIDLVNEAMLQGHNQYAPMPGVPALREGISGKIERSYGIHYDPASEITITAGGTQAIFTALAAIVHPGDEVIIIDPAYDCYRPAVELFGGKPVHVPLDHEMRFDAAAVEAAITPRTRVLMINSPHNPGGRLLRHEDMLSIERMLRDRNIILISDEVYEHITFDGQKHRSAMLYPDLKERAIIIYSFGKTFHATGWKIGYAVAPAALMKLFRKVHQFNVFSVNTPVQHALTNYIAEQTSFDEHATFYQAKRDQFLLGLKNSRFVPLPCEGSYFMVADYSAISNMDDLSFAKWLAREHKVAAIPLSPFYKYPPTDLRLVRFCFAKQETTLNAALERLCAI